MIYNNKITINHKMPNNDNTDKKPTMHASEIMRRLYLIERDQKETDITVKKWADDLLMDEHLKLVKKLSEGLFDRSSKQKKIITYFHCLKILLKIDEPLTSSQLLKIEDLEIQLISYIRDTDKKEICQDSLFLLSSIFSNADQFKDCFTEGFLTGLFDLLDIIEDDLNFKSAVKILIEINTIYTSIKMNTFLKVYHIHSNSRVFNEILIRLINIEADQTKLIKMFLCLSNIFDKEEDNILYSTDLESLIDIIILKLQAAYTEELKVFIIDMMEKIMFYPEYYKKLYKIDDIVILFEDFVKNDTQEQVVRLKAQKVLDNIRKNFSKTKEDVKFNLPVGNTIQIAV